MIIWKSERTGLVMIAASLLAMLASVALVLQYKQNQAENQIRIQAMALVQLLAEVPFEELVPKGRRGALDVMYRSQSRQDMAFAVVSDSAGTNLVQLAHPGIIIPSSNLSGTPDSWNGEREILLTFTSNIAPQGVLEFFSPLLQGQDLVAQVRLGYFKPTYGVSFSEIPFLASVALCVFLLTAAYYVLMRRELAPLKIVLGRIESELNKIPAAGQQLIIDNKDTDLVSRFNAFVHVSEKNMAALEAKHGEALALNKVLSYRSARIERVLNSLPDGIILLDEMGSGCFANGMLKILTDIRPDQVLGHPLKQWCLDPQMYHFISRHINPRVSGVFHETLEVKRSEHVCRDLLLHVMPLYLGDEVEDRFGFLVVLQDKAAEVLTRETCLEFVSHVAHELKSPLNVLAMSSEVLQQDSALDMSERVESANIIHDEVERLAELINNLLSLTKIEMGSLSIERKHVKLSDLIADAFESISRLGQEKRLKFKLNLPKTLGPVAVDKDLLRIALNNLLTNAIKYNREDGEVIVSVEDDDAAVRISVRDTGLGISREDQSYVFDRFYRSEERQVRQRSGHGLGLSLARDIVNLHQGRIHLNSELGEGTEFIIELQKEVRLLRQVV